LIPRLVIVHDQAADLGGQERAVQALMEHYPTATAVAPRFLATNRPPGHRNSWDARTRLIGRGMRRRRAFLAPLYGLRVARSEVPDADVVLSITQGAWSAAVRVPRSTPHVCYSSGLPPHLYGFTRAYLNDEAPALRPVLGAVLPALRAYDRRILRRPKRLIANSEFSARELRRVHRRPAEVVYPPVRTRFFTPGPADRRAFLVVARLVSFKRVDMVIDAFRGLEDELVVAGGGPALTALRSTAPANVRFVGPCDDEALLGYYRSSRALICPSVETFGLAMAEAQACGTPVIGARAGGAPEAVREGVTGMLLDRPDPRSIAESVRALDSAAFSPRACRVSAERFSEGRFTRAIDRILTEELEAQAAGGARLTVQALGRAAGGTTIRTLGAGAPTRQAGASPRPDTRPTGSTARRTGR
jgi:glycosyltransferase involved in cell wall biosynthesis